VPAGLGSVWVSLMPGKELDKPTALTPSAPDRDASPVSVSAVVEPSLPERTLAGFVWQGLILTAVMVASLSGYLTVLWLRGPEAQVETYLPIDELVPFHHGWVWVYLIPYLIGPVVIGLFTRRTFLFYITRGLALVGITLVIFILIPTKTRDREPRDLGQGLTARLYEKMIEIDNPPANAAPSLHISLTTLLALALLRDFPRWWPATLVGVGLVWFATLATRQHHFIDVVTGALLAAALAWIWPPTPHLRRAA
jgi:membrane-associated phospholipid phosphatase